jgi:hypothetical protein
MDINGLHRSRRTARGLASPAGGGVGRIVPSVAYHGLAPLTIWLAPNGRRFGARSMGHNRSKLRTGSDRRSTPGRWTWCAACLTVYDYGTAVNSVQLSR